MADDVSMAPDVAQPIIDRFSDLAAEFDNSSYDFLTQSTQIDAACGQFQSFVSSGSDSHHIGWRAVFRYYGEATALVAGNTNVFEVDLKRLDEDISHQLEI